jgi:hypothetical protein
MRATIVMPRVVVWICRFVKVYFTGAKCVVVLFFLVYFVPKFSFLDNWHGVDFVKLVGNLAELFRLLLIEVRLVVFIGIISLDDHASAHQEAVFIVCCLALH